MRIAIDARMMGADVSRGIGRYIEELVRAMLEIAPEHRYVLVARKMDHSFASHPSVETIIADIHWYRLEEQIKMPRILASTRADVVHIPHWNVPLAYFPHKLVITIHDLLLRHEPASAKTSTRNVITRSLKHLGYRLTLDHAISTAQKILVPTQFVAHDVTSFYPRAASKIVVTGEGIPPTVYPTFGGTPPTNDNSTMWRGRLPSIFLLYVGSAYPHKGLDDLLIAWETIAQQHQGLHLVIAGEMDEFMQRVKSLAIKKQLPHILFLGQIKDNELPSLYARATAFIYPSRFEGFGLPPLEALIAGCPVIASDADALIEVLGPDGATFFHRGDINDMLRAITEVLQDSERMRAHARSVALQLAERHTWKRAAQRTLAAIRELL